MADKGASDKPIKNSLLSTASTGFSLEDFSDARLLVPVALQEDILKASEEATAEIDLQSDDVGFEGEPVVIPQPEPEKEQERPKSIRDSTFISFFSRSKTDSSDKTQPAHTPSIIPPPSSSVPAVSSSALLQEQEPSFAPPPVSLFVPAASKPEPISVLTPELLPVSTLTSPPPSSVQPEAGIVQSSEPLDNRDNNVPALDSGLPEGVQSVTLYSPTAVATSIATPVTPPPDHPTPTFYNPNALSFQDTASSPPPATYGSISPSPGSVPPAPAAPTQNAQSVPSSVANQGLSVNKYRLGHQRPQYAQYPGLLPSVPATATMGNLASQPPPPVSQPAPPSSVPFGGTTQTASSPLTPSFPQEYAGTGYVFGEPPPMKTVTAPNPMQYTPVSYHWFFYKEVEGKGIWKPFSFLDSVALEEAYLNGSTSLVATDGGRYDVNVTQRLRFPVYWEENPTEVRRCSWFYKGPLDNRFIPYEEEFAQHIEHEFEAAISTGIWQRRVELGGGEAIIMHNPNVIVHFCQAASPDEWGNLPENQLRPRVVKRGVDKTFMIEDGEAAQIDHLVFLVHGIGAICDFKFRSIVEAVDDFRSLSNQMLHTHFGNALEKGLVGRIEFLPVCWHKALHGDCGVDRKLKPITLQSIPKLRHFANDTLLDILFYTSPFYCQRIVDTVGNEINRMFNLFLQRNLTFDGSVSLGGHSLGSLILFDLLSHQPSSILKVDSTPDAPKGDMKGAEGDENANTEEKEGQELSKGGSSNKMVSYTIGHAGTGQLSIKYPAFDFLPTCFFAMGSPTGVFISVRGIDVLGQDFKFPTCPNFFNIFHPYDPVAYRMEPLVDPNFDKPPVVIPHHKGRKRFHLEIKDAMFKMGTDIKQTMVETIKTTWKTVYSLASFGRNYEPSEATLEQEIDRVIEGELSKSGIETQEGDQPQGDTDVTIGQLNGGRRIDYVLQEGPLESFNEYLFALSSHVCYWESEDTMLMIMKEIYQSIGVYPDSNPASNTVQTAGGVPQLNQQSGVNTMGNVSPKPSTNQFASPTKSANPLAATTAQPLPSYSLSGHTPGGNSTAVAPNLYNPASFSSGHYVSAGPTSVNFSEAGNLYAQGQSHEKPVDLWSAPPYQAPVPAVSSGGYPLPTRGHSPSMAPQALSPSPSSDFNQNPAAVGPPPLSGFVRKS